ncbi:hypothetical protein OK074_3014 [Actinobacteria bacterium OK074]|nr:hypothetical protein OK074_3014 [Actinobacteria bacterium OK074]
MPADSPSPLADSRAALLAALVCPVCRARLEPGGGALRCAAGHAFDVGRHGHVGLLTGRRAPGGDSAAMVRARTAFLRAGHYAPLTRALAQLAAAHCPLDGTVLDAGTGTGHHLAAVLDALPAAGGLALDTSAHALRAAARAHPRALAVGWDVWRPLPVATGAVDLVLNVFAPRNGPGFHRVLRRDGTLLVVTPGPRHLAELRSRLGLLTIAPDKERRLRATLSAHFRAGRTQVVEYAVGLTADDIGHLVAMGPSARHVDPAELRRRTGELAAPLRVTVSFRLSVHRPRAAVA